MYCSLTHCALLLSWTAHTRQTRDYLAPYSGYMKLWSLYFCFLGFAVWLPHQELSTPTALRPLGTKIHVTENRDYWNFNVLGTRLVNQLNK